MNRQIPRLIALCFALSSAALWAAGRQVVEIDVKGLTCPFCVYGLSKNLGKVPGVTKAEASLEARKVRIELAPGIEPRIELYNRVIRDAGFTPGQARTFSEP